MNHVITIDSTSLAVLFLAVFVATLIIIGFVDMAINLTRFVLKMIQRKRRSGLWDPLGELMRDDDHRDQLTDEEADEVIREFNARVKRLDKTDPPKMPPAPLDRCKMPLGGAMCRPSKPIGGVDDKPRAEVDGGQDDEAG